jgi:hypothetical protein
LYRSENSHAYVNAAFLAKVTQNFTFSTIDIERKNRLFKVCYVPATSATFLAPFSFFLAVAINSTNEPKKAGSK